MGTAEPAGMFTLTNTEAAEAAEVRSALAGRAAGSIQAHLHRPRRVPAMAEAEAATAGTAEPMEKAEPATGQAGGVTAQI